jgi:hypothetical protein
MDHNEKLIFKNKKKQSPDLVPSGPDPSPTLCLHRIQIHARATIGVEEEYPSSLLWRSRHH